MELNAARIAVLDVNHGGLVIAGELKSLGYNAFAVDMYRSGKASMADVKVVMPEDARGYDLVVAPVHMAPNHILADAADRDVPVITHHRMAGMLIAARGLLRGVTSVEITGTYGKTTTCAILSRLLQASGEKVLLHASNGLTFDGEPLGQRLSITPANMIEALNRAGHAGCRPSVCVFEVSLGGTGTADLGIITTLDRDYPIAGDSRRSNNAKMQMIEYAKPGCTIIHDASYGIVGGMSEITFGEGGDFFYDADGRIDGPLPDMPLGTGFSPDLCRTSYERPVLCAVTAALRLGVDSNTISAAMSGFKGVPGRMMRDSIEGRVLVDNSCSGLTVDGVRHAVDTSNGHNGRRVLVIGEERYNVCEGLQIRSAISFARSAGVDAVITVGDRMRMENRPNAPDLEAGVKAALGLTVPGDMIISCVKTWR